MNFIKARKSTDLDNPVWSDIGMTSPEERAWWMSYSTESYQGKGAIVDLGSWFGSTACALAEGLRSNPNSYARNQPVHAIDRFIWEPWMERCVQGTTYSGKFSNGDDFMQIFNHQTKRYGHHIIGIKADLMEYQWTGGSIEFLLIDAMKSWPLANSIIRNFYPHLMPGISVILHQDFAHFYTWWIHILQYRMRNFFDPMEDTIKQNSLAFKLIKPIPEQLLRVDLTTENCPIEEIEAAFSYSRSLVAHENLPHIEAARVMAVHAQLGQDAGMRAFLEHEQKYQGHITVEQIKRILAIS